MIDPTPVGKAGFLDVDSLWRGIVLHTLYFPRMLDTHGETYEENYRERGRPRERSQAIESPTYCRGG